MRLLANQHVLVLGGRAGIGLATARQIVEAGGEVTIANAVMFLLTTPFATGSTVRVDGGGAIA